MLGADGENTMKVFRDLGVASAVLSEEDAARMIGLDEVEGVFPNEMRSVPKPISKQHGQVPAGIGADGLEYLRAFAMVSMLRSRQFPGMTFRWRGRPQSRRRIKVLWTAAT